MSNSGAMRKQAPSIRVLIADGHTSNVRELKELLSTLSFIEIVGEAVSGSEAVELAVREHPDVVLIAEEIPGLSMFSTMRRIFAKRPRTRVFVIGEDPAGRDIALGAGAEAYFIRQNGHKALREALVKLHARSQFPILSPEVKAPPPILWTNRKIWIAIGSGVGLGVLASVVLFPSVSLPTIALICGLLFFLYGLKYYLSVALILFATTGGGDGNGNGLNGVFNGMGVTNGLKRRPEIARQSVLRMLLDRVRRRDSSDGLGGRKAEAGSSQKKLDAGSNGNPYKFPPAEQPFISIHLPLYNESRVVDRLLQACTRLDYQNYEVLIADDSTDKTLRNLEKWAKHPKVRVSHRINRTGFKGAALKHAMEVMDPRTHFVVIFDADFIPPPNILHQFLSYFYGVNGNSPNHVLETTSGEDLELIDESLAVVQGYQWHILNASENWITRGVRTEFSGSYVVERPSQELTGGMKMISGSVFMIRADLLRSLGWGTSITEDWELTIRLYIDGYRVLYSPFIQAPAECVSDFKQLARQRMRWAEGHTFNVKRYFFPILRSKKLTRRERLEFIYYVPYYLQSAFFIVGTLAWLISEIFLHSRLPFWTATLGWSLVFTNTFALLLMNVAGLFLERGVRRNWAGLLSFILLTFLLVPYQAYAAVKGLLEPHEGGWHRTDKTGVITEVIDKLGLGRHMRRLMPKPKRRSIDLSKRLGTPLAKISKRLPKTLQRLAARPSLALRIGVGLALFLMLLAIFSSQIPLVFAAPDSFFLRDTTANGASPAGKDMNTDQGSTEDTLAFDSADDEAYWYTDVTYPTGGEDASLAAGSYTLNMHFNQLPNSWWDTEYKYRQPITITAGSANVPADYSVRLQFNHDSLTPTKSLSNGDDVRIVYWTGSEWTELDRRLDDQSSWDSTTTQVWFSTQAIINATESDSDYYLYYGNSAASNPPTSWSNIFLFYDDFNDGGFDTSRWTCTRGTCNESGGTLTLNGDSSLWATSPYAIGVDSRWEARIQLSHADGTYYNYWGASDRDDFNGNYFIYWTNDTQHEVEQNGYGTSISPSTPTSFHNYICDREGTSGIRYRQDSNQLAYLTSSVPTGNLRAFIWVDDYSRTQTLDWVRVRKYVSTEPSASPGAEQDAPYVKITVSVYHTKGDGTDPSEIITSSTITIDANKANPYTLPIGSGLEQTFTSADPRRLRVHIDVAEVNGSGSFTLAYDSVGSPSSLDTPEMMVPAATLLLLLVVVLIPIITALLTRKRRLALRLMSVMVSFLVALTLLSQQVLLVSADPDVFYLRDTTTNGASPAGEDMNNSQGSTEDTKVFDSADDETYWYTDITYPTGGDDASVAAGNYTFNMYFNQLPQVPADWYNASWLYRKPITIYGSQVAAGGVSNLPVLIKLSSDTELAASACNAPSAGYDILFTSSNGTTKLSHEIESFNDSTGALVAWVKVPSLTNPANTTIYMYYGNSGCTNQQDVANVWTSYVGVWHFTESSGTGYYLKNSRQDDYHADEGSTQYLSGSIIGGGRDTNNDYSTVQNGTDLLDGDTSFTLEFWGYPDYATDAIWQAASEDMFLDSDSLSLCRWQSSGTGTGWIQCDVKWSDSSTSYPNCTDCLNRAQWNHIVLTYDGSYLRWYINGSQSSSGGVSGKSLRTNSHLYFGTDEYLINSNFDEFRYASTGLGAGWIETEYNSQSDPANFYGVGSEETLPSVEIAVSVYHTKGDGTDPQEIVTSSTITIDANTSNPYALPIGSGSEQTFTATNPQRLRVLVDVAAVNGSGSFTLAYDSSSNPSSLDTPILTVPDPTLILVVVVILIPIITTLLTRKRRLALRIMSVTVSFLVALTLLSQQVLPVSADPDVFYLRDTTNNGASPAGQDMNSSQGSTEDTLVFDDPTDEAYWYSELTYPTGDDDASIVAGAYTLNMYFNQLPTLPSDWYSADWTNRKKITIDADQVPGDLTSFPVLISLASDSDLAADAQDDGDDILFTSSNGTTKLSHELERFIDSTGELVAWVEVPSVSGSTDTEIYMYYGNPSATNQQDVANTWDNGFVAVQHLHESTGTQSDSTGRGNSGTLNGTTTYISGEKLDGSRDFDGSTGYIGIANSTDINTGGPYTDRTITLWFNADTTSGRQVLFEEGAQVRGFNIYIDSGSLYVGGWNTMESGWSGTWHSTSISADTWYYVTLLLTGGTSTVQANVFRAYLNGSSIGSGDGSQVWAHLGAINVARSDGALLYHDGQFSSTYNFDGTIDELRISNATRSADWITTTYNNQNSPTTFYTLSSEEYQPTVDITVSVYHTRSDGTDPQEIITSSSIEIYCGTSDPYALPIGNGAEQTFTSSDPRRLRVHIDVTGVNGSGSFTLAYDSAANPSSLDTPSMVIPEWGLAFLLLVPLIPYLMSFIWRRRRLAGQIASVLLGISVAVGLLANQVAPVSAAPDTFYLHDTDTATTAITLDATSSNTALNTSSISWSHTIGSGNHRKLIVGVSIEENVLGHEPVTSVTYNSTALTYANAVTAGTGYLMRVEIWYLDEAQLPSSGTYTIQVNTTGSVEEINAGAVSIAEAQSGAPEATATNTNINSASITTNITTITNGAWVIDAIGSGNAGSFTPGIGQTERWDVSAFSATGAMSTKPVASAGLTSMQQTHSTMSNRNAHVLIAVAPNDTGLSPSGKYMNITEGSAGSTMTFNSGGQDAYWYADETWPTGNDNATIAAGDYTFNMYFNQLPAAAQVNLETFNVNYTSFDSTWVTVTKPSGTAEDDLLIAIMSHDSGVGTLGAPGGWTPIFDTLVSSFGCTFRAWYLIAGASEPANYTFTSTDSDQLIAGIMRFSGHDLTNPIDVSNTSTGMSNAPTASSVTTTVDDALVLRVFGADDDFIMTDSGYPSGHTGIFVRGSGGFSGETSIGAAYMTQASQGSTGSAAFSMTWPEDWAAATIAIAPAVPEVDITVSVYHTASDGSDATEIVTSSSTTINADTADPYALDIGSALQQTFTSSDPRRLRLHVYVDSTSGGGSFTLDYDGTCATNRCSNLDTPVISVPERAIGLLPIVMAIPIVMGAKKRRKRKKTSAFQETGNGG